MYVPDASRLSQQHFYLGNQQGLMRLSQLFRPIVTDSCSVSPSLGSPGSQEVRRVGELC